MLSSQRAQHARHDMQLQVCLVAVATISDGIWELPVV